jgi:aspartyl aminopeptidase
MMFPLQSPEVNNSPLCGSTVCVYEAAQYQQETYDVGFFSRSRHCLEGILEADRDASCTKNRPAREHTRKYIIIRK